MINEEIAAARALIAAATKGSMRIEQGNHVANVRLDDGRLVACFDHVGSAKFFVAARGGPTGGGWPAALDEVESLRKHWDSAITKGEKQWVELLAARGERDALRAEVSALRSAVLWVCDAVQRVHMERRGIHAVRQAANLLSKPFDLDTIEIEGLDDFDDDDDGAKRVKVLTEQLAAMTAARDSACNLATSAAEAFAGTGCDDDDETPDVLAAIAALRKVGQP